ncbi:MAG: flippase [Sphaerobacter sp.]|nr:flippase [Sphaerobacter sp.]
MSSIVSSSLRTIARNAASVLVSEVVTRASAFVLYALVTRHLGLFRFGQLSLAMTLVYTAQVLAAAGLKTLIVREAAKDRTKTGLYLVNGSLIVLGATFISLALLLGFVWVMDYGSDTTWVVLLLALTLVPYALQTICEALFQAVEQMHFIAYVNLPLNVARALGVWILLRADFGIYAVVGTLLAVQTAIAVVELWLVLTRVTRPTLRIDTGFVRKAVHATAPFLGIDVLISVSGSIPIVLLSYFSNESNIGLLSAANQLLSPVMLLYQSVVLSLFPVMCRRYEEGIESLKQSAEGVTELLLAIALPIVVGLTILGDRILVLVYGGQDFALATFVLRIVVWQVVLRAYTTALGQVLLAGNRERTTLSIVAINTVGGLALGMILVSQFGLLGAAITIVATRGIGVIQHYVRLSRIAGRVNLITPARTPALASLCMGLFLVVGGYHGIVITILAAAGVYVAALVPLTVWSAGGVRQFRTRYLQAWSE